MKNINLVKSSICVLDNIKVNKMDSVGLFSGRFKVQVFKTKKDKLISEVKKQNQRKYWGVNV